MKKVFVGVKLARRGIPRSPPWGASNREVEYGSSIDPYSRPGFLPEQLKSELNLPCAIGTENLAKVSAVERTGRVRKICVVEQIEDFRPKLQVRLLRQAGFLE